MKKIFLLLIMILTSVSPQNLLAQNSKEVFLPAQLIEGRFFLKIPTIKGDTILGFCDTGGGYTAIYKATVQKLGLDANVHILNIDGDTTKYMLA